MKTPLPALIALLLSALSFPSHRCLAQGYKSEKLHYLDIDGAPVRQKDAYFIEQVVQIDDTAWEHNLYRVGRPMVRSMRCKDEEGNFRNGRYYTYNEVGIIDTTGTYSNGKRSGTWVILTRQGRLAMEQFYKDGELIWTKDTIQLKHESDSAKGARDKDSAAGALRTFTKVEIESGFPGGSAGWLRYLNKNLRYPDYAVKYKIQGTVVVTFVVDTLGQIGTSSVYLSRSVEYNIDHEAVRIIFDSPEWTPAIQNGRKVRSYKRQPIIFKFS